MRDNPRSYGSAALEIACQELSKGHDRSIMSERVVPRANEVRGVIQMVQLNMALDILRQVREEAPP